MVDYEYIQEITDHINLWLLWFSRYLVGIRYHYRSLPYTTIAYFKKIWSEGCSIIT